MKIRITQSGMETYTGPIRNLEFVDGVSTREATDYEIDGIAGLFSVEGIDENGEGVPVGLAHRYVLSKLQTVEQLTPLPRATEQDLSDEKAPKPEDFHTREQLEAIADASGLKGLREIGDKLGVKGKAINNLILEILKAETAIKARWNMLPKVEEPVEPASPWTDDEHEAVEGLVNDGLIAVDEDGAIYAPLETTIESDEDAAARAKAALESDADGTKDGATVTKVEGESPDETETDK